MLRVCIDARLVGGVSGGLEPTIIGLAGSLSKLHDGQERYYFLTHSGGDEWLRPFVQGPCQIVADGPAPGGKGWRRDLARMPSFLRGAGGTLNPARARPRLDIVTPGGGLRSVPFDVLHSIPQSGFLSNVPTIYHPHDLQHRHMPQFFSSRQRLLRELVYRVLCHQARVVVVESSWARDDLIRSYRLREDKVRVIPFASVLAVYPDPSCAAVAATRAEYSLPDAFLYYPAQTWPHKNHLRLLEALSLIRDRHGICVPLVCSGRQNEFFPEIRRRASELGVLGQLHWLGFVDPLTVRCLYRLCRGAVVPSLFEAASGPLYEALESGVPAACSNITSLPAQADGAALLFDPYQPRQIADAVYRLWTDVELRTTLAARGRERSKDFSWDRTARTFRAVYRSLAGRPLTADDQALLDAPPPI